LDLKRRDSDLHPFHADPDSDPGFEINADPDPGLDFFQKFVFQKSINKSFGSGSKCGSGSGSGCGSGTLHKSDHSVGGFDLAMKCRLYLSVRSQCMQDDLRRVQGAVAPALRKN